MIDRALAELECELRAAGVVGGDLHRVCAEARAHLEDAAGIRGEADALAGFGAPRDIAHAVAAELAVARTRRAAYATFAGLSLLAVAYVVVSGLESLAGPTPDLASGRQPLLGVIVSAAAVLLPQVAVVAGGLALVHARRIRGQDVGRADLTLLRHRARIGLVAGAGALLTLAVRSYELGPELAAWWPPAAFVVCGAALAVAVPAWRMLSASARPAASEVGHASDVFDDLAALLRRPLVAQASLRRHPWRFAGLCALAAWGFGVALGTAGESLGDGLFYGTAEALSLLAGFALLGRALGLRRLA